MLPTYSNTINPNTEFGYTSSNIGFGQTNSAFSNFNTGFGQTNSAFSNITTGFGQTNNAFSNPNTGFGQTNSAFSNSNIGFGYTSSNTGFGQTNSAFTNITTGFGYTSSNIGFGQSSFKQVLKKKLIDRDLDEEFEKFDENYKNLKFYMKKFKKITSTLEDINQIIDSEEIDDKNKLKDIKEKFNIIRETYGMTECSENLLKIYNGLQLLHGNFPNIPKTNEENLSELVNDHNGNIKYNYMSDGNLFRNGISFGMDNKSEYYIRSLFDIDEEGNLKDKEKFKQTIKNEKYDTLCINSNLKKPISGISKNIKKIIFNAIVTTPIKNIKDTVEEISYGGFYSHDQLEDQISIGTKTTKENDKIIILPDTLKILRINLILNEKSFKIYDLPINLEKLYLDTQNYFDIPKLPTNLKRLIFTHESQIKQELILPDGIEYIELPEIYEYSIKKFPKSLKYLKLSNTSKYEDIPNSVTHLKLAKDSKVTQESDKIPKNLKVLNISKNYNLDTLKFETLSDSIEDLILNIHFENTYKYIEGGAIITIEQDLEIKKFPKNLKRLYAPLKFMKYIYDLKNLSKRYNFRIIILNNSEFEIFYHQEIEI